MYRIFLNIHNFIQRYKTVCFVLFILILSLLFFFASKIKMQEDVTQLIPAGEKQNLVKKVLSQTRFSDKIIVSISANGKHTSADKLTEYAGKFIDSVNKKFPAYVSQIQGKVAEECILEIYDFVHNHLPLFLDETDYEHISSEIEPDSIKKALKADYRNLISPTGLVTKRFIFKDPLGITNIGLEKLKELQVGNTFELYHNYLITKDHKNVLLFITPTLPASETDKNQIFVNGLENILQGLNLEYSQIHGDFFGSVLYSLANANRIKKDIRLTMSIAVSILLLLLIYFYRRIYVPLILFIPSFIGALLAVALISVVKGNISAISLGLGAILLGISIDYALHILTHFRNNASVEQLYKEVCRPVIMSSLTTAIAFLCLIFLKSEALKDLGIFSAISVLSSAIFSLILIPLLYKSPKKPKVAKNNFIDFLAGIRYYKIKGLVAALVIIFIASLFIFNSITFNSDLSSLNYEPENLKKREAKIENITGKAGKSIFMVAYGNTLDEALTQNNQLYQNLKKLKKASKINNFSSIGGVVLSTKTQNEKIAQWDSFWTPAKKEKIQQDLVNKSADFGFKKQSFRDFYKQLDKDFKPILLQDYKNASNLYLGDFISQTKDFATVTTTLSLPSKHSPNILKKIKDNEGILAIDRQEINESFLGNLKTDFNNLLAYSIIAVFLILLISYKNLELSILTLLPIGVTWVVALGIMVLFKIEFNILNIIISTFIFGLGLDYSIFITDARLREYQSGENILPTYQASIVLSAITSLLGMGALVFAGHPALKSVSLVSIIGVISALAVSFILQNYLFQILFIERAKKGLAPLQIKNILSLHKNSNLKSKDVLFEKTSVLNNYRYKPVYPEAKREFSTEKERYLKVSEYLQGEEEVLILNSGNGLLALFLSYKLPKLVIVGYEPSQRLFAISRNLYRNKHEKLEFKNSLNKDTNSRVFIIAGAPKEEMEQKLKNLVTKQALKVILMDASYNFRWIIDLNFEISYRQNHILILQKTL